MILGPATILGGGAESQVLPNSALRIVGAHVAALGPHADVVSAFPDEPVWDAAHRVIVPGLVNAFVLPHAVLGEGLLGYADVGAPARPFEDGLDADGLHVCTVAALLAGLRHGVTTTFLAAAPYGVESGGLAAIARAAEEVPVRVCIAGLVTDRHGAARTKTLIEENAGLVEQARKGWGDRLRAVFGLGPLAEVSQATLEAVAAKADAMGAGVLVRTSGDEHDARSAREREGTTPIRRLVRAGLLNERTIVTQARALPEPDWELVRASGTPWVSTPREDAEEHGMSLDYVELGTRGLIPAFGTGSLTPHLFGEAEMAYRGARLRGRPAREAKRVAAAALFDRGPALAQKHFVPGLGSLLPGSPADLAVLDVYPATPLGPENWTDHLLQSLASARVHSVMVAGELLLQEGRPTAVDEREVQKRARAVVHRLWPQVAP
jgi:5-methylthioadenosine/S-adenosylhomocysteine deaminase